MLTSVNGSQGAVGACQDGELLVVGSATVEQGPVGQWFAKVTITDYINELATYFDHCTWLVHIATDSPHTTGVINDARVSIVALSSSLFSRPQNWWKMVEKSWRGPYVLLYLPAAITYLPVLPFVRHRVKRLVTYLAGDFPYWIPHSRYGRIPGGSWLYRKGHEYPMEVADAVIARGKYLARLALGYNKNVVETVPLGHMRVAEVDADQSEPASGRHVLCLGNVLWAKGFEYLMEAFQFVTRRHPDTEITLDIVGDGKDRQQIEARATVLGLSDKIQFHGWIEDHTRLGNFFRRADVLVAPSSTSEGVPRVIDEALIREVPVIATSIGGIPDEFDDDQVLMVEPRQAMELANALERMLFDADTREVFVAGARRRRAHWLRCGTAARQHAMVLKGLIVGSIAQERMDGTRERDGHANSA